MSQRFEGKNLDEALTFATQAFGVERWQLTYHVLLEKRGFLGGVKRVVVEAEVNTAATAPAAAAAAVVDPPAPSPVSNEPRPAAGRGGRRGGGSRERNDRGGRTRGGRNGGSRNGGGARRSHGEELQSGDFEKFFADAPEQGPESDGARIAREWCEDTIALGRFDLIVRTSENDENIVVHLYGGDTRRLVDRHGELLDAIQVLANKALVGRKVEKQIELDCEGFKEERSARLAQQARDAADRVRAGDEEELLPAMSPIERRIVHIALQDDPDVTTESRGEGFLKRVAVVRRGASAASAETAPTEP